MKKKVYFEWMRIIAIVFVIFNHLPANELYMNTTGIFQVLSMFLSTFIKINVPLFFMVSGALLLGKEEDYKKVLTKRVWRFVLVLLIFDLGLYMRFVLRSILFNEVLEHPIQSYIWGVLRGYVDSASYVYWYIYAYIGFLLTLPFMQRIAKKMNKQDFIVLLVVHFVYSSLLPMMNVFFQMLGMEPIEISGNLIVPMAMFLPFFFPLMGYYLETNVNVFNLKKKHVATLCATLLLSIIISCSFTYYEGISTGVFTQNFVQLFDYVMALTSFILIKYIVVVVFPFLSNGKMGRFICWLGPLTFGIYLLDPYLKIFLYGTYQSIVGGIFPELFISIGWIFISMGLGSCLTVILKKLPIFRKIL